MADKNLERWDSRDLEKMKNIDPFLIQKTLFNLVSFRQALDIDDWIIPENRPFSIDCTLEAIC